MDAIGTMLEKAVVKDSHWPMNSEQALPFIFVNHKLYGMSTEDDPHFSGSTMIKPEMYHQKLGKAAGGKD